MYIVGIGASSGGLEALKEFFSKVEKNDNVAYVVIRHLKREHISELPSILKKYTILNTSKVEDGTKLVGNHVYVMPEGKKTFLKDGKLYLETRPENEIINKAIDYFFFSLAKDAKENAIGLILSGFGDDGALGAKAITDAGGMVLVQSPETTIYDSMPQSVIKADHPTFIIKPSDMYRKLAEYVFDKNGKDGVFKKQ